MAEEVITIEDFLEKLTNGDFKQYFDDVCREQNKDIEETTRQIKELFKNEQTLNLKTILDLKNFLKDVLQKHPTRSLLLKKLKFSNGVKYDLHELFFIKSVYLFLRALNSEHSLLKDPLNFINFQIHLNPELNKNVEILYKDGKHVYFVKRGFDPYRDENLSSIIHGIFYYNGLEEDMNNAKKYMQMQENQKFFEKAAMGPRRGGKKYNKKSKKLKKRKSRKYKKSRMGRFPHKKSRNKRR